MAQPLAHLGPQVLSLFDAHICEGIPKNDRPDIEEIRTCIEDRMESESADLWKIKVSPLMFSALRYRRSPDGEIVTCTYNPFAEDEMQDRANMLVVASSVSAIALLQLGLIASEYTLIGGGMAFGDVLIDGSTVHGGTVDEALALKNGKSSVYPRMAVSDEVKRMFDELCARHQIRTDGRLGNAIEYDADGVPFINYLSAQYILDRIRGADERSYLLTTMDLHKVGIERMIEWEGDSIRSDELLRKRYEWLISYHNRTVRRSGVGDFIDPSVLDRI